MDGELVSEIFSDRISANLGVMPWMFGRSSAAYEGGGRASGRADGAPAADAVEALDGTGADTRFPDLDETERESILEELEMELR